MILFPIPIIQKLTANHFSQEPVRGTPREIDFTPVVKIFNPFGAATWLLTELDPETRIAFGLADLGMGCPELGSVWIDELINYRGRFRMPLERDLFFNPGSKSLGQYASEASRKGAICA